MGIQLCLPQTGGSAPSPIFGPCLLWPNCWMDQGTCTWHGGGPWSRPHCARWGHSSPPPKKGQPPIFGPCLLWQTVGWIKTPLGTEVDLGPGHLHLHLPGYVRLRNYSKTSTLCIRRVPSYRRKRHSRRPPVFGPCLLWQRSPISATAELLFNFVAAMQWLDRLRYVTREVSPAKL